MAIFDPKQKPTIEGWKKHSVYMEDLWSDALTDMAEADSIYFGSNNIWKDWEGLDPTNARRGKRPNLHGGRARALIDQAVASNLALEPDWVRIPVADGKEHRQRADSLENGMRAVVTDALMRGDTLATRANGKQLLLHAYTQLGVFLDTNSLKRPTRKKGESVEDFEEREWEWSSHQNTWNPIRLEVPNPGEVLMSPMEKHPPIALRKRTIKAYELADLLQQRQERFQHDRDGRYTEAFVKVMEGMDTDAYKDVEIEEWWSASWYGLKRATGDILLVEPNARGIQPFGQAWSGSALMPTNEEFNLRWRVQQSFIFQEKDALVMLDQATVAHHQLLQRKAWARVGTKGDTAQLAEDMGGDYLSGDEADTWLEKTPDLPSQSFQHLQSLASSIEQNTYSPMNVGFRQPGVDTATGILTLSEAGHRIFRDVQVQLEGLWSLTGSNILKLIYRTAKEYGKEFEVIQRGENSLRVEDMEDKFPIEARFEQVDAAVAMQERIDARIDLEAGRIDTDTYYKIARYEDAEGIRKRIYRDMIYRDPDVIEQGVVNALRQEGMLELADRRQNALDIRRMQRTLVGPDGSPLMGQQGQPLMSGAPQMNGNGSPGAQRSLMPQPPQNPLAGGSNANR